MVSYLIWHLDKIYACFVFSDRPSLFSGGFLFIRGCRLEMRILCRCGKLSRLMLSYIMVTIAEKVFLKTRGWVLQTYLMWFMYLVSYLYWFYVVRIIILLIFVLEIKTMKKYIPILGMFIADYPVKDFWFFFIYQITILGLSTFFLSFEILNSFI